jgi:hypothetical protein
MIKWGRPYNRDPRPIKMRPPARNRSLGAPLSSARMDTGSPTRRSPTYEDPLMTPITVDEKLNRLSRVLNDVLTNPATTIPYRVVAKSTMA